uniref:Ion transport domain-containing protein n=1 Tax=Bracon brevicornis TaxID=1563983 RepID=A0A6V7K4I3_9HYME
MKSMNPSDRCPSVPVLPVPRKRVVLEQSYSSPEHAASTPGSRRYRPNTSLLLSRWLAPKKTSIDTEENAEETWDPGECCMEFGKPPPVEEPHCYSMCMSESSVAEDDTALFVSRDIITGLLTEHMRKIGGRLQLIEDLETGQLDQPQNLKNVLQSCKTSEINGLLLYACYLGRDDMIPIIHAAGADVNHCEQERGITGLHLCAYADCLKGVRYLTSNGAIVNYSRSHTPFHYAAFGNSLACARFFLDMGFSQDSMQGDESVLHAAARSNSLDVVTLLAKNNSSLNKLDSSGLAPIHHAADRGDPSCLSALLDAGCSVDLYTRKGETALHLAAEGGCTENVELLLKHQANVRIKNHRGHTALHLAARSHSLECVEALLRNGSCDPNVEDNDGRTALHLALGRSLLAYDVTEFLIGWRADVNKADKYGYTPLHVAALNELSQCVDVLIQHGADLSARTKGGTTALSIILRKTPTSLCIFKQRLDASITLHQQSTAAGEMELRLDFHPLLQHKGQGEIGYLGTFVKEGYKEILEHPLCQSFLHLKWQKIRKYYVGRLFFYLLYVVVLTCWVMTALAHNCYNESHGQVDETTSLPLCANSTGLKGFFHRHPEVLEVEWYALVVLTVLEGLRKATGILTYPSIRQFLMQPENIVEWCVILSVFATSFVYTGRTYTWQSHVGAFAVLCGWSNLMLMIGQLPMFGAYVAMFTSVQAQVFKLLLAYACLLVGFTASFCVIFPRSKSFSSPHTGLIKVLVMMTGELDFEELFFPGEEDVGRHVDVGSTSWILLQVSAQLSFVLFLLFVTIVLMNLLVGIAVHDIKGLQKTAGLAKLVRQTKLICDVESALLLALLPHKLIKLLSWTTLVLPSPLRAVLTVRPLNPRENRLPRDVLVAAHRVAKNKKFVSNTLSSKRSSNAYLYRRKSEPQTAFRYLDVNDIDYDYDGRVATRLQDRIIELTTICESNRKLIQELVAVLATDSRFKTSNKEREETIDEENNEKG